MARKQTSASPEKQGTNRREPPPEHRFKPGQSGNPGGRPRGRTLLSVVRQMLADSDGMALEEVAAKYVEAMKKGSFPHLKEYIDREEGKVPDRIANADGSNLDGPDLSKLTTDELTLYRALLLKAKGGNANG